MDQAQEILLALAKDAPEPQMLAIDEQIENKLGEKERAIGALNQHRSEHGC